MNSDQEFAFVGFAGDYSLSRVATFQEFLIGVDSQAAFDFRFRVAADAIGLKNGLNLRLEIRTSGECRQNTRHGE
jgi:hypothetical protein